jgi:antirestriction protein ArdC
VASQKAYEVITARIVELLEQGVVPWRKPWRGRDQRPANLISGKPYRGINSFVLNCAPYASPWFVTYNQAKKLGGHVRRGEHGFPVVWWNWLEREEVAEDGSTDKKRIPVLRHFTVFSVEQCGGLEGKVPEAAKPAAFNPIAEAEAVVLGMPSLPRIGFAEARAWYRPSDDTINMPRPELFERREEYYSTLFHELAHSTGHKSRLDRPGIVELSAFGSHTYSREELVAELGAAFLCGHCGLEVGTLENSAAYIGHWLGRLKEDPRLIVVVAAQAQKAADHILGKTDAQQAEKPEGGGVER